MNEGQRERVLRGEPWCPVCESDLWDDVVTTEDDDVRTRALAGVASCPAHEGFFRRRCPRCGRVSDWARCPACGTPTQPRPGAKAAPAASRGCCG